MSDYKQPGEWHERYREQVKRLGNDRFMHVASPGATSERVVGGGVWWPLRLNDMDPDAALVVALVHHEMLRAAQEADTCRYSLKELAQSVPRRAIVRNYRLDYEPWLAEEVEEHKLELEIRLTVVSARYDYLRELLEAAYVA